MGARFKGRSIHCSENAVLALVASIYQCENVILIHMKIFPTDNNPFSFFFSIRVVCGYTRDIDIRHGGSSSLSALTHIQLQVGGKVDGQQEMQQQQPPPHLQQAPPMGYNAVCVLVDGGISIDLTSESGMILQYLICVLVGDVIGIE